MSLHVQAKLKKETASAEKYLKFLMATYVSLSSGYSSFKIGESLKLHKVDKHTFSGLLSLGWVSKLSTGTGLKYYWRGPVPTLDNVDDVKKAISKHKNKTSTEIKLPVSKSGKPLIPIVKEESKVRVHAKPTPAIERYYSFLKELKLITLNFNQVDVSGLTVVHEIGKGAFTSTVQLGLLVKDKKPGRKAVYYKWNTGEVTYELAQRVLTNTSLRVKKSIVEKKNSSFVKPNVDLRTSIPHKTVKKVKETAAEPKSPVENTNLNKDFAMKLFKLGFVEEANQVLDTLISVKQ